MVCVLFVDVQHTVTSVMAESWFNYLASGWGLADSCGMTPAANPDGLTIQVMREEGIMVPPFTPQAVTDELLAEADIIVSLNSDAALPDWSSCVWDYKEPPGRSIELYRELRTALFDSVTALIYEILLSTSSLRNLPSNNAPTLLNRSLHSN